MNRTLLLITGDPNYAKRAEDHFRWCAIDSIVVDPWSGPDETGRMPDFDVALVDLDASTNEPLALLRALRAAAGSRVLLACSQKAVGVDLILAYEAGADDHFSKSTDLLIVEAKVRRAIRRSQNHTLGQANQVSSRAELGPASTRRTIAELVDAELTRFEHRLLRLLISESGSLVSRRAILEQLWGRASTDPKLLYEHVSTLRSKLVPKGWTIANVRGKGYRLERRNVSPHGIGLGAAGSSA